VTGVSAGLVVARMAKFEDLRNEARRIIWAIDYIYDSGEPPRIIERRPAGDLLHISAELYALKHKAAGDAVSRLLQDVTTTRYSPPSTFKAMEERYLGWQRTCREPKPDRNVIFSASWKL
jgi:hypothetical protein